MVTRPNKVFSATYFTAELETARYFLAADTLSAYWACGDARFGVHAGAALDAGHFERLFAGLDESGQSLLLQNPGLKKRVSAYELSVGVSKSISAVWALASPQDREAIERAFAKSLEAVTDHVERNAFTRLGANGTTFVGVQPNIAVFMQPDTRPVLQADGKVAIQPQLHAHIIGINLVAIDQSALLSSETTYAPHSKPPGGNIPLRYLTRSLDGQPLYRGAKSWGAVQHLAFATELQRLGYHIGDIGKNGTFEILPPAHEHETDRQLREFWSSRRAEIVEKLREAGLTTGEAPALAAKAAVATRRKKVATSEDAFARWREEAVVLGIDVERYIDNRLGFEMPAPAIRDAEIASRMVGIPTRLTEFETTFTHHDLIREIAAALVGTGVEASRVDQEAEKLLSAGAILQIGKTDREQIFSTEEMIRLEREVVEISARLAARPWRNIDLESLSAHCVAANLSGEQTAAVFSIADGNSIGFVDSRAGTGKTTAARPLCRSLERDFRIIATGVSWRTALMLQTELSGPDSKSRIEARALDSWLATSKSGGRFCDSRTLLLVDESSQIGVRAMHTLLSEVEHSGACVGFLGDRRQVLAVSAGSGIELVARAVEAVEISKVVRQNDPQLRELVEQLADGNVGSAMSTMADRGCIVEASGPTATVKAAVNIFFEQRAAAPQDSHLLICKSNATRLALDAEVRRRLRAENLLAGDDVTVDASTPSGRAYRLALATGERIRFGIRCKIGEQDVINGTTATIKDVVAEEDGHALIIANIGGREVLFSSRDVTDDHGRVRLSTDYAITIWSAQGLTSRTATIVADSAFDSRDCYVALSRAKEQSVVCVDSRALDFAIRAENGFERPTEDIAVEERREHLVRQMSRWRVKSSTLDFTFDAARLSTNDLGLKAGIAARHRAYGLSAEAEVSP
ncbi:MAG: relaxase domain-containing protein [Afipia sp.]|nr:relaxase domain-containing protein [Afipia sp.]